MLKSGSYYWIKRCEPDGAPEWEPARFIQSKVESYGADPTGRCYYWSLIGNAKYVRQVTTPGASNRWTIGPELTEPVPVPEASPAAR